MYSLADVQYQRAGALDVKRKYNGFTLIELMIVVVIISILIGIAYPNYRGYLVKTRRSDAMAVLQQFANAMERYHMANNDYAGAAAVIPGAPNATVFPSKSPLDGTTKYYDLTIEAATVNTFTIRATPIAGGKQAGDGYLELNETGALNWVP
jgi:type IV pilus assembly protein PilE